MFARKTNTMASEVINTTEDAEMAECDGEKVVTMMDVLQEQEEFEEDANAVLGASDEKNCTYSKGYIKRQAIYACLTCCHEAKSEPTKRAGVCLACSLTCHENHELVELYTKRNFRCDCGNPKFSTHLCQHTPNKTDLNEDNSYNQNFSGLYCICQRPYPDPESEVEDEMIQCIICEDWLHASHLDSIVPANNLYSEMICKDCMEKNEFLHDYSMYAVSTENVNVDVVTVNGLSSNSIKKDELNNVQNKDDSLNIDMVFELSSKNYENTSKSLKNVSDQQAMESEAIKASETDTNEEPKLPIISAIEQVSVAISESNKMNPARNIEKDNISATNTEKDQSKTEESNNSNNLDKPSECKSISNEPNEEKKEPPAILEEKKDESNIIETSIKNTEQQEEDRLLEDPEDENNKSILKENNKEIKSDKHISDSNEMAINNGITEKTKPSLETTENKTDNPNEFVHSDTQNSDSVNIMLPKSEFSAKEENENSKTTEIEEKFDANMECDSKEIEANSREKNSEKRKLSTEESTDTETKKKKIEESADRTCIRPKGVQRVFKGATFWPSTFRLKLCTCRECTTMYNDLSVLFLIDPEDTMSAYERLGKAKTDGKPSSQYEKGLQALSSLDRIQQINALTEYNKLRDKLLDFLKSFKDKKEIVKEEDIKAFFAGMKPKREPDGVYFCR